MDQITLRTVQLVELKILLEFKRICDKYSLKYFLHGGTLLGAVRHKGFIPWDDDIDVGMMRSDYEKFLNICEKDLKPEFSLHHNKNDSNHPWPFAKIRIDGTEYKETINAHIDMNHGLWIDIFPFDSAPNNKIVMHIQSFLINTLRGCLYEKANYTMHDETIISKIGVAKNKFMSVFLPKATLIILHNKLECIYNAHKSSKIREWSFVIFPNYTIRETLTLEFEGYSFSVPKDYDTFLKISYGDYMQLPPEEERISHSPFQPNLGKYKNLKQSET